MNTMRCSPLSPHHSVLSFGGPGWIRTSEGVSQQIYSLPRLATSVPTQILLPHAVAGGIIRDTGGPVKSASTHNCSDLPIWGADECG
jgi:hypothetical protein